MKKLITTYVSLILVFSPLIGQTKQEAQLMPQSEYERKEKWNIQITEGGSFFDVALWNIIGDSLVIGDMESTKMIYIGSIANISATKVKSKAWKYAKIGIIIGIALPLFAAVRELINCDSFSSCSDGDVSAAGPLLWFALTAPPFGLIGAGVGAGIGSAFKQNRTYDMSDWSIDEKRSQIQKIMKK